MARMNKTVGDTSRKADKKFAYDLSQQGTLNGCAASLDGAKITAGTRNSSAHRQLAGEQPQPAFDSTPKANNSGQSAAGEEQLANSASSSKSSCPKTASFSDGLDESSDGTPTSPNEFSSSPLKVFKCSHCPFSCNQIVKLDRHQNKHYVKADHQCTFCSFSCRSSDILEQHLRLHTMSTGSNVHVKCEDFELQRQQQKPQQKLASQAAATTVGAKSLLHEDRSHSAKLDQTHVGAPNTPKPSQLVAVETMRVGPLTASLTALPTPAFIKTPLPRVLISADAPATVKKKKNMLCCTSCPYKTMHGCDMKAHSKMHEDPPRMYPCSSCTYSAMRVNALRTHELLHTGVQPQHIRIVTEPALVAAAIEEDQFDPVPSTSSNGPNSGSKTLTSTVLAAEKVLPAVQSLSKVGTLKIKPTAKNQQNGAPVDADTPKRLTRHIKTANEIGAVSKDAAKPEVTLRVIYDRSNRFIGEKRCLMADYEKDEDSKRDDSFHFYRCAFCYERIERYSALFEHMRDHFSSKRGKTRYTCKDCDFSTDKLVHIRNHKSDCTKSDWMDGDTAPISPPPRLAEEEDGSGSKGGSQEKENNKCSPDSMDSVQERLRHHNVKASSRVSPVDQNEYELPADSRRRAVVKPSTIDFCEFTLPEELTRAAPARATLPALLASRAATVPIQLEKEDDDGRMMDVDEKDDNEDSAPQLDEYPPTLTTYGVEEELSPPKSLILEDGYDDEATDAVAPAPIIEPAVKEAIVVVPAMIATPQPTSSAAPTRKRKSATQKSSAPEREFRMCTRKKHLQTPFATTRRSTAAERGVPPPAPASTTGDTTPSTSTKPSKTVTFDAKSATGGTKKGKPIRSRLRLMLAKYAKTAVTEKPAESESRKRPRLQCRDCPFETTERLSHQLHLELHNKAGRPFKCNVCTYNCFTPESLHAHLSLHAPPLSPTSTQVLRRRRYASQPPPPANVTLAASALIGTSLAASTTAGLSSGRSGTPAEENAAGGDTQHVMQCPQCRFKTVHQDKFLVHRMEHVQLLQQRLSTTIKRAHAQASSEAARKNAAGGGASSSSSGRAKSRHLRRIERMHVCAHCSFKCDSAAAYSRHLEFHGARQARFRCSLCDYGAQTHNVVLFHERHHHQDGSVTAMYKYMNERKRVEEHNRKAEKKLISMKKRKLDKSATPGTDAASSKSPSPDDEPSTSGVGAVKTESSEDAKSASENVKPSIGDDNDDGERFQMKAGQFRCVRCDLVFFDQYDFGRHWDDRHVNVANATAHDIEIGAKLRLGLVPHNSMRIVC